MDWSWWEPARLAIGAFLTSSGFGGLAAFGAALLAFRGIRARIGYDQSAAVEADARERWWQAYTHLWDNREKIADEDLLDVVASLEEVAETAQQTMMLDLLVAQVIAREEVETT